MFLVALVTVAKRWKQPKYQQMNGYPKCGICMVEYYSPVKKEWNSDKCCNVDGP